MKLVLGLDLLLELLLDGVEVGLGVLEGGSEGGFGMALLLESTLGILELMSELLLQLGESSNPVFGVLHLTEKVTVISLKALLGQGQLSIFLDLAIAVRKLELELLG